MNARTARRGLRPAGAAHFRRHQNGLIASPDFRCQLGSAVAGELLARSAEEGLVAFPETVTGLTP